MSHVGDCSLRWEENKMEMDMNAMKAEIGGAFVVAWLVVGMGWGSLGAAVVMAAVWMAFSGAHVLPVITWMHMMTGMRNYSGSPRDILGALWQLAWRHTTIQF